MRRGSGNGGAGHRLFPVGAGVGLAERVSWSLGLEFLFGWEFTGPERYARALATFAPACEALQNVGQAVFVRAAGEQGEKQRWDGLPLRARVGVVG